MDRPRVRIYTDYKSPYAFVANKRLFELEEVHGAELEWLAPLLATVGDASLYRVQAGPYASRADAQGAAARLREALGLVPVIVERR